MYDDELDIFIEASANGAKNELNKLIEAAEKTEKSIKGIGQTAADMGNSFKNAIKGVDFANVKGGVKQMESYIKSTSKDLAKSLILQFNIEDDKAQNSIKSITETITRLSVEAAKAKKIGGDSMQFSRQVNDLEGELSKIVAAAHNVREEVKTEVNGIYKELLTAGKIKISDLALKGIDWKSLDGLLKQHLSTIEGSSIKNFVEETSDRLGNIWEGIKAPDGGTFNFENDIDQVHILIELLAQYRREAEKSPLLDRAAVGDSAWEEVALKMDEVFNTASKSFLSASEKMDLFKERVAAAKQQMDGLGSDYAYSSNKFFSVDEIEKEIDSLQGKLYNLRTNAQLKDVGSKAFEDTVKQAALCENKIESLRQRIDSLSTERPEINFNYLEEGTRSLTELVQDALTQLGRLYNNDEGMASRPAYLGILIDNFKELKAEIAARSEEYKAAFGEDTSLMEALDTAIDTAKDKMIEFAKAAQTAQTAVANVKNGAANTDAPIENAEQKLIGFSEIFKMIKAELQRGFPLGAFEKIGLSVPKQEFLDLQKNIADTEARLDVLKQRLAENKATAHGNFEEQERFRRLKYEIAEAESALEDYQMMLSSMGNRTHNINWDGMAKSASEAFGIIKNAARSVLNAISKIGHAVTSKISSGFKNMAKHASQFDLTSKGLAKSLLRVSNMLKLMVTRMALRGVINEAKAGFKDLMAFSDKTAESYNKIRNAIRYLADSLAALSAPLLNASSSFSGLGNIIDMIADKVVDLVNKINQLTSALLGHSTWIKATKQAYDYAGAATAAGKAASKALQGFDELNNLSSSSGGGGGSQPSYGGAQYEELPIDQKWTDIADWLKEQWEKGDFTELGSVLGEKLKDALDSIPWEGIKEKCRRIGTSIGTFINGFVETEGLAQSIGTTIGEAINSGLELVAGFVDVTHFDSIGTFIGESVVNAIETIDWDLLKGTASDLGAKLADGVNAFFDTGVLESIGKAVGECLVAGINLFYNFVEGIKFEDLGEHIKNALNNFLDTMSAKDFEGLNGWQKLGTAISDAVIGAIKAANIVLGDKETREKIAKAVTDFLDSIKWSDFIDETKKFIVNLVKTVGAVIKGAWDSETFKEALGDLAGVIALVIGGKLVFDGVTFAITGLAKGIADAVIKDISTNLASKLVAGKMASKIGAGVNSAAASTTSASAAGISTTSFATVASAIGGAVIAAVGGFWAGKKLGEWLLPQDAEYYKDFSWSDFFSKLNKEDAKGAWEEFKKDMFGGDKNGDKQEIEVEVKPKATTNQQTYKDVNVQMTAGVGSVLASTKPSVPDAGDQSYKSANQKMTAGVGDVLVSTKPSTPSQQDMTNVRNSISKGVSGAEASVIGKVTKISSGNKKFSLKKVTAQVSSVTSAKSLTLKSKKGKDISATVSASWQNGTFNSLSSELQAGVGNTPVKVYVKPRFKASEIPAVMISTIEKAGMKDIIDYSAAKGGIYKNGSWKPIERYAAGGLPDQGQMFIAREAGAELVGSIGNSTAVMNNDQIVASVSNGVYKAVMAAMGGMSNNTTVTLEGDAAKLFKVVQKYGNDYQRRTGNTVFA